MSKYTTQLRWIVEQIGQGLEVPEGQEYADAVYKYIGLSKYPIFDENYRSHLNDKIIDHYYFREIGQETAAQFAQMMKRTMQEIMPKYNRLYDVLQSDLSHPLADYTRHRDIDDDYKREQENVGRTENTSNSETRTNDTSTTNDRNVFSDTPMSMLSNSGSPSIAGLDYATNVTYDDATNTINGLQSNDTFVNGRNTTSIDRNDTRNRVEDEYGRNKSLAYLLDEFIDKYKDIDVLVINDLSDLFFKLW